MGALHEGPMPQMVSLEGLDAQPAEPPEKKPRVTIDSDAEQVEFDVNRPPSVGYSPSIASIDPPDDQQMPASEDLPEPAIDESMDDAVSASAAQSEGPEPAPASTADDVRMELEKAVNQPVPTDDELHVSSKTPKPRMEQVFEVSMDIMPEGISDNPMCLWGVLDECFQVTPKAKLRRVEVSFRKLSNEDQKLFEKAMQKESNSWIENKVTSLCKSKGIPTER